MIKSDISEGVLTLTLDRPERLNALDSAGKAALGQAWHDALRNPEVRAVVLQGAGERAFCAGSDLKEIGATGQVASTEILASCLPGVAEDFTKPVVAALHGHVIGLGISIAMYCDFRIASPTARFRFPEVEHNMLSGFSAIELPSLIGEAAALDIMLTGRAFDAVEAQKLGLVSSIEADPHTAAQAFTSRLAGLPVSAMGWSKRLLLAERRTRIERHMALVDQARREVGEHER
ncbi:enoyl-CoA hydratase/isomerase family protein [Gluconobacter sp. Dm-62]|uniref:enoyl-CoA hydratase/isomerase family protein n=1 Tax=Gluconobacter sp. Dm-62 TaxID=2799804 RepID=UPI001B8D0FE3|nr:enoyl-CoA hydratase/isomerase family protein [Gluconobacter sp. Dm-62]MBS1103498.1 enoyl-CoA hydratase/isomerase family protein [Gluconobacter sp. Dm-62]